MSAPRQSSADTVVQALAEVGIQVTPEGRRHARAELDDADASMTPEMRQAARDRYAQYTSPA